MGRGFAWLDTGTHSLLEAAQYIETVQRMQNVQVANLEEKRYQCRQIITKSLKLTCKWWLKRLSLRQFNQIRLFSIEYYNLSLVRLDFFIN